MKSLKLILRLLSNVKDKIAYSLWALLAVNHGARPNFLNRFKTMKYLQSTTSEVDSFHYLKNKLKTVNQISEHGLIVTMYLKKPVTYIEKQILCYDLPTYFATKLESIETVPSNGLWYVTLLGSKGYKRKKCGSSPTISCKIQKQM